jgi:transcriptional regulator with XRE-family HTH domain
MDFGELLRRLRHRQCLSLREVQERAGVSNAYLSMLETGRRPAPGFKILRRLAPLYGVAVQDLASAAGNHTALQGNIRLGEITRMERQALSLLEKVDACMLNLSRVGSAMNSLRALCQESGAISVEELHIQRRNLQAAADWLDDITLSVQADEWKMKTEPLQPTEGGQDGE